MIGMQFGRWKVICTALPCIRPSDSAELPRWKCECDCGTTKDVRQSSLLRGDSTSCGCLARELASARAKTHGLSGHPLAQRHFDMLRRCYDTSRKDYKHYGGRGISVCDRWKDGEKGLENFIEDMYPTYITGLEVDRIDVNGDYTKENCRWVDRRTQVINRRRTGKIFDTHLVEFEGKTLCLSQWEDVTGINRYILSDRLTKLKWSVEKALTTPVKVKQYFICVNDINISTDKVFRNPSNIYKRAKNMGISAQEYMAGLFYGRFKLVGIVNKQLIEFKPTCNLEHLLNTDWLTDDFVNISGLGIKE